MTNVLETGNLIYCFILLKPHYSDFKRLGSRGFHDLFNQYLFSFLKHYEYCKTEVLYIKEFYFRYFE